MRQQGLGKTDWIDKEKSKSSEEKKSSKKSESVEKKKPAKK
jgi:hypothetical protein